jgi:hypothetical protein
MAPMKNKATKATKLVNKYVKNLPNLKEFDNILVFKLGLMSYLEELQINEYIMQILFPLNYLKYVYFSLAFFWCR